MKAKITHKSNVTANGDYEIVFDVLEDETIIYPRIKMLCKTSDNLETKIASRIKDIENHNKTVELIPEEIEIAKEVEEGV